MAFQTKPCVPSTKRNREQKREIIKLEVDPSLVLNTHCSIRTLKVFLEFCSCLNMNRVAIADYWGKHWDSQNRLCLDISLHSSNVFNVRSWSQFDSEASSQKCFLSCSLPCQTLIAFTLVSTLLFKVTGLLLIGFTGNASSTVSRSLVEIDVLPIEPDAWGAHSLWVAHLKGRKTSQNGITWNSTES